MRNKSALIKVFGDTPYNRVMDFLLTEARTWDYSLSDISKHTKVAWSSLHVVWPAFIGLGIVVETRRVGRAKLFKLNEENPLVRLLIRSDYLLAKIMVGVKTGRIKDQKKEELDLQAELKSLEEEII